MNLSLNFANLTFNEFLLIVAIAGLLLLPYLLTKHKRQPLNTYITLTCGVLLLILAWAFNYDGSLPLRIIVTAIVIKNAFKAIKEYQEYYKVQR